MNSIRFNISESYQNNRQKFRKRHPDLTSPAINKPSFGGAGWDSKKWDEILRKFKQAEEWCDRWERKLPRDKSNASKNFSYDSNNDLHNTQKTDGIGQDALLIFKIYGEDLGDINNLTPDKLKSVYRKLSLKYHPDQNPASHGNFEAIKYAYDALLSLITSK